MTTPTHFLLKTNNNVLRPNQFFAYLRLTYFGLAFQIPLPVISLALLLMIRIVLVLIRQQLITIA